MMAQAGRESARRSSAPIKRLRVNEHIVFSCYGRMMADAVLPGRGRWRRAWRTINQKRVKAQGRSRFGPGETHLHRLEVCAWRQGHKCVYWKHCIMFKLYMYILFLWYNIFAPEHRRRISERVLHMFRYDVVVSLSSARRVLHVCSPFYTNRQLSFKFVRAILFWIDDMLYVFMLWFIRSYHMRQHTTKTTHTFSIDHHHYNGTPAPAPHTHKQTTCWVPSVADNELRTPRTHALICIRNRHATLSSIVVVVLVILTLTHILFAR